MSKYLLTGKETERLWFRQLGPNDFGAWLPFHQEPLSTQFWEGPSPEPKVACANWFDKVFHRYKNGLGGMNALISKAQNKLIGQCGLLIQEVDGIQELEIGYSILPEHWKNGYASEAALKCRNHAFDNQLSKSLISIIHVDNVPSQKVALSLGMQLDKTTTYKDNPVYIFRIEQ